ncbi:hypothetical protein BRADI_1g33505v3 [Brachypodium distachyon]|uniref:Uncharacterized protein n=1 Tax=Brachypodium distachyon TaxID=15368 RepID=A0A2K2DMJ0_BRADI|nr:hypothetical protein BRADI_1g33505v3 [Brachypodium distachyon]
MGRPCPTPAFPLSLASRPWGREIKQPLPPRGATSGGARRAVSHREGVTANGKLNLSVITRSPMINSRREQFQCGLWSRNLPRKKAGSRRLRMKGTGVEDSSVCKALLLLVVVGACRST